jgi:hypothetical protein
MSTSDFSPGHRALPRIFANPKESQLAEITQLLFQSGSKAFQQKGDVRNCSETVDSPGLSIANVMSTAVSQVPDNRGGGSAGCGRCIEESFQGCCGRIVDEAVKNSRPVQHQFKVSKSLRESAVYRSGCY